MIIYWFAAVVTVGLFLAAILIFWTTQPLLVAPKNRESAISVSPEKLRTHAEKLSQDYFPRSFTFPHNLDKAANYIKQEFEKAGGKTSEQTFDVKGTTYRNVIARFGAETKERIVIGAHYDSAGALPAADDNASGVAGLIELAYLLGKTELNTQVELVAFTLEEPPFFGSEQMGSFVHAASLKKESVPVRLMISLEMIGYFSDEPNSQKFPVSILGLLYPTRGNFIVVVSGLNNGLTVRSIKSAMSDASDLPVYSINAPAFIPGIDFSDHKNYWHFGYNAVMITDTAFYRNFNYHTGKDTAEKLDYNRMSKVVKGVHTIVIEAAK